MVGSMSKFIKVESCIINIDEIQSVFLLDEGLKVYLKNDNLYVVLNETTLDEFYELIK